MIIFIKRKYNIDCIGGSFWNISNNHVVAEEVLMNLCQKHSTNSVVCVTCQSGVVKPQKLDNLWPLNLRKHF